MKLIHERQTPYGKITVEDSDDGIIRGLFVDGVSQGRFNTGTNGPQSWYMQEICDKVRNYFRPQSALVLGGGAGIITSELEIQGIETDTVEISADVLNVAQEYFNFNPRGKVVHGDAFKKLGQLGKYDIIVVDLYHGAVQAEGPNSFFDGVMQHLKPKGHMLGNILKPDMKQIVLEVTTQ